MPRSSPITKCLLLALIPWLAACQAGDGGRGPASAAAPPSLQATAATAAGPNNRSVRVTLITGDRVEVDRGPDGVNRYRATAAPGRSGTRFVQVRRRQGGTLVIPADADALLASGQIDPRLFDVDLLVSSGYHDGARAELPLVLQYQSGPPSIQAAARAAIQVGARETRALASITGSAVVATKTEAARFWASITGGSRRVLTAGLRKVWLDGRVRAVLDASVPQIGAPAAWQAGYTGEGVKVAVLDSGIDANHPDLAGKIVAAAEFVNSGHTGDRTGHGTHVAATVAGSGAAGGGRYKGVAPGASLLNGKVLDDGGSGSDSSVIAGMEWAVAQEARVANLSLGAPDEPGIQPLEEAVNQLTARHGILFVIAAGNEGEFGERTLNLPGSADAALTVGAVSKADALAVFSSRGPRLGDFGLKPDITAPGVGIVAARVPGTEAGDHDPVDQHYARLSGTSMATPHVAGAAALLAQRHPAWRAAELKPALMASAKPQAAQTVFEQGAGRVDVARGIDQSVYASPPSLGYGLLAWPQSDDSPVSRTLTYRNTGPGAAALVLTATLRTKAGEPAPAGMLRVSPAQVSLPPGGTASVTVTLDPRLGPTGQWTGLVTATAGSTVVQTPVGFVKEVESYDYTITTRNRAGRQQVSNGGILNTATLEEYPLPSFNETGTGTVRLPIGRYVVYGYILPEDFERDDWVLFGNPDLLLDRPIQQLFDGRQSKLVSVTVERPGARLLESYVSIGYRWGPEARDGIVRIPVGVLVGASEALEPSLSRVYLLGSAAGTDRAFTTLVYTAWAQPSGTTGQTPPELFRDSPYSYTLAQITPERVPTSPVWPIRDADLARVIATYAATAPGFIGWKMSELTVLGSPWFGTVPYGLLSALPFTRTEYYTPGVDWEHTCGQEDAAQALTVLVQGMAEQRYTAGARLTQRWNQGPFGPGFAVPHPLSDDFAYRQTNRMRILIPMFSDSNPARYGFAAIDGQAVLYRNGMAIAAEDAGIPLRVDLPPEDAAYRLTVEGAHASNTPGWALSTRVTAEWTFRSAQAPGVAKWPLPLMAVRYTPPLDERHRAPAGGPFSIPITVQRQVGDGSAATTSLTVEASYDDGATWVPAAVTGSETSFTATLNHPPLAGTNGYVALRARATDNGGAATTQTILRAYVLTAP